MEKDGLIFAYLLDGKGSGQQVYWEAIDRWKAGDGVLWMHVEYSHEYGKTWLMNQSQLDPLAIDALLAEEHRPRATLLNQSLLLMLRGINVSPESDPEDMVGIRIWSDGQRIITTRKRRLLSAADIADALEVGEGPKTAGEFMSMLAARLISRMHDTIEEKEDQVAAVEETIISTESYGLRSNIAALRRDVISLRRYLAPQREALLQLQSLKIPLFSPEDLQTLREVAEHLSRYVEALDSVRDRAAVAQEELANRLAEQMNNRMYVLSLVAVIFLPLGFLTGLLGINVGGIPGADNPWSFWIFVFILITITLLQYALFKNKKWF